MARIGIQKPVMSFIILALVAAASTLGYAAGTAPPPLRLEIQPSKQIFSNHEGIVTMLKLTATTRTKVCLANDILSQIEMTINRSGVGSLPLLPMVIEDKSQFYQEPLRIVWLEAGQSMSLRLNLKRYLFANGERWKPGNYSTTGTFNLCEQTPATTVTDTGQEIPIKAQQSSGFMIAE